MDKIFSPIKGRVIKYIDTQCIKKEDFYTKTGITSSNFKGSGKLSEIGGDKIVKILSAYRDINPEWLLTGEGEMLRGGDDERPIAQVVEPGKGIPLIPTEAFCGYGTEAFNDLQIEEYYHVVEFKHANFLIRVKGNSMYPKYSSGDIVACKKITETLFFQWNKIYAIYTNSQGIMVKRVNQSNKDGYILLVSDNEKYRPFDVPLSDIVAIALVIGVIRVE